jgi:hypothetical protein
MKNKHTEEMCRVVAECMATNGAANTIELLAKLILGLSDSRGAQELVFKDLLGSVLIKKIDPLSTINHSDLAH